MRNIQLFNVAPSIPEEISFLETLAHNFWWCWTPDAIELFRRINTQVWRETAHNPLVFLSSIPQRRLETLPNDDGFMSHLDRVRKQYEDTILPYVDNGAELRKKRRVAYFSLEYGIHESLRFYSGGLGGLAGDHLKAASDLNVPLVAVGLMYRQGYFQQYLNNDGWQQETYPENEIHHLPMNRALDLNGTPLLINIPLPTGMLKAQVWRLDIGRVPLYLLDSNIPVNPPDFRSISGQLYGGDRTMRIRQEILLGIGGYRALLALGYDPIVCHMNEGHAAFLSLQKIAHLVKEHNMDIDAAQQIVMRTGVFTTHTPVPAGNETFDNGLLKQYLDPLTGELGINSDKIISWGQADAGHNRHEMSMTVLGLRMARYRNGVSQLHGKVARKMWMHLWPDCPEDEIPIIHITNGIHESSWLSPDMSVLYDRYLGPEWRSNTSSEEYLAHIAQIPDEELWRAHELGRTRLIRTAREVLELALRQRNATRQEVTQAKSTLSHDILTIGFARRFATYKRGNLLLRDPDRLIAMLTDEDRPLQIIFAGKAHPADDEGKDLIRQIVHFSRKANVQKRVVFLENYDMYLARTMVQGVDVWLNTPRRPLEASGTSGMKAAVNGAINLSVLDGWWCEGYAKDSGWAIGHGEEYDDPEYQDTVESQALFNMLENEVIPTYYENTSGDPSTKWIKLMKGSIKMALGYFTSHRMVSEYQSLFYQPALKEYESLADNNFAKAKDLVTHKKRLNDLWREVRIGLPVTDRDISSVHVGDKFTVSTIVNTGQLTPEELEVQIFYGPVNSKNKILESHVYPMDLAERRQDGTCVYKHEITCKSSGRYAFTVRAVPAGGDWGGCMPGFITWADSKLI